MQYAFSGLNGSIKNVAKLSDSILSIPVHPFLEIEEQEKIVETIVKFLK